MTEVPGRMICCLWDSSTNPRTRTWLDCAASALRSSQLRSFLARSTLHLCQIADTLREKGVDLVVLDQNIDTSDATGRLLFNMLGAIGQFETEIRAERQMDGIKKAKDPGV